MQPPSAVAVTVPDSPFSLAQAREHLRHKPPRKEQRGRLKTIAPSNNRSADAHELVAFLSKLYPSQCWDSGLYSGIYTVHKLAEQQKHNTGIHGAKFWMLRHFAVLPFLSDP